MSKFGAQAKKMLPALIAGICVTLAAALFNYLIHERRFSIMATDGGLFISEAKAAANSGSAVASTEIEAFRIVSGLLGFFDDLVLDSMYSVRGRADFPPTREDIALVAIDAASIVRRGVWPWSRREIAGLLQHVSDAKVTGLDLLVDSSDQTSLVNYIGDIDRLYDLRLNLSRVAPEVMDNDLFLAREISRIRTVIGAVFQNGEAPARRPEKLIANYTLRAVTENGMDVSPAKALLKLSSHVLADLPVIRHNRPPPLGEGFMNLFPSPSGMVRSVPLFAHVLDSAFSDAAADSIAEGRQTYPSIVMEMLRVSMGGDGYTLTLADDPLLIPELRGEYDDGVRHVVKSVAITRVGLDGIEKIISIPLSDLGEMKISFRYAPDDYRVYPAWEVLDGLHPEAFKDRLVLVGSTMGGIGHFAASNNGEFDMAASEAHAAMLASVLQGRFMRHSYWIDFIWQEGAIVISGFAVTLAVILGSLGAGLAMSALSLLATVFGNYYFFFRNGVNVGITLPILSILAVLITQTVANYLIAGRERRFIRKAFSLNVSPSILGYLESHPDRLSSLQGEQRNMTVLFSDIRGFTSISERMTAPNLARFLNEYFTPMSDIVIKNMGTVDKFIGDALMAFWNAPTDNPRHARDAAQASLDMIARLAELQAAWTVQGLPRVAIGCGINTGPMFAGYMGSEQRKNYTVMGDNVNIASRLEGLNKVYSSTILITESTRKELGQDYFCRVVDKVRVSGKNTSVLIYELLSAGPGTEEEREENAAFTRVFELYMKREFAAAESLLKELVFIRPTPLYKMYLDRLAIYKALPPPPDWDGTFSMRQK